MSLTSSIGAPAPPTIFPCAKSRSGPEDFGAMTYDPAFLNTASCQSAVTFIDGDKGIGAIDGVPRGAPRLDPEVRQLQIRRLIGRVPTIAAYTYRHSVGFPYVYPDNDLSYTENFMNMLWRRMEPKYQATRSWRAPTMSRTAAPT